MADRVELQTLLEGIVGSENVYFQPPSSIQMSYPCIVYDRSRILADHAGNNPYSLKNMYTITVMDRDPDSYIPHEISKLSGASFDRHFKVDNLNHDVFTMHF